MAISDKPTKSETQRKTLDELARVPVDEAKRLNVPVQPEFYRQMKQTALNEDRTLAEITRALWADYMNEEGGNE